MSSTDFKNNFTWSFSRHGSFESCKRKYYYTYYGSWGGWEDKADKIKKKIYMLKNMTNLPMLAGSIVHDQVEKVLKSSRRGREIPITNSKDEVIRVFKKSWKESKNKDWQASPKWKTNLFEHYYGRDLPDEKLLKIRDLLIDSIDGFYASDSYRFIQTMSDRQWLSIEDLDSFEIKGSKVWVKLDFAIKHGDRIYIYDWKTGQVVKENETQLAIYSLYACGKWEVDLDHIRLFDVYLHKQIPVKIKPTKALIDSSKKFITSSMSDMKKMLKDEKENKAQIEDFPMVSEDKDAFPCSYCNYNEICFSEE